MNKIVQPTPTDQAPRETPGLSKRLKQLGEFDFHINKEQLLKQAPFMCYVFLLIILFIYNSHRAEQTIRETNKLRKEVKDLRSEYITVLSEMMRASRQSTLSEKLASQGLKELKAPPYKISYHGSK